MRLSKSKFVAGVQCLKRLYLQVHQPELATEPNAAAEAIIEQGRAVGMLARRLFPGGVEVYERSLDQAIRQTRDLVANPQVPAIFEGVFEHEGVLVRVDPGAQVGGDVLRHPHEKADKRERQQQRHPPAFLPDGEMHAAVAEDHDEGRGE